MGKKSGLNGGKIAFDVESYSPNVKTVVEEITEERVTVSIVFSTSINSGIKEYIRGNIKVPRSKLKERFEFLQKAGKMPQIIK